MTLPSQDHPIFLPSKLWASGRALDIQAALESGGYDLEEAQKLARGLAEALEGFATDEERNYNTIERWLPPGVHVGTTAPTDPEAFMSHREGNADVWIDTSRINDEPANLDQLDPFSRAVLGGSAVELPDGRVLYVWADSDGTNIRQGYADDMAAFTSGSSSVTEDRILFSNLTLSDGVASGQGRAAVAWSDSRLRLTVQWWSQAGDHVATGRVYESSDNGGTWSLVGEFFNRSWATDWTLSNAGECVAGPVRVLDDGSWVLAGSFDAFDNSSAKTLEPGFGVYRSTDLGATWTRTYSSPANGTREDFTRTVGGADNDLYVGWMHVTTTNTTYIFRSTDRGATWAEVNALPNTDFNMNRPGVHVAPYAAGPDGYQVVVIDSDWEIQRYLVPDPAQPVNQWEVAGDRLDWAETTGSRQTLLQDVGGNLILNIRGSTGTTVIIGTGNAELNLWTGPGADEGWVPVASTRILQHTHDSYALTDHDHDGAYAEPTHGHAIDDLTDVDTSTTAPADGDHLEWDGASSKWVPAVPPSGGGGGTWELIGSQVTAADGDSVSFTGIDAAYKAFRLTIWAIGTTASNYGVGIRLNNDASASGHVRNSRAFKGTSTSSGQVADPLWWLFRFAIPAGQPFHAQAHIVQRQASEQPRILWEASGGESSADLTRVMGSGYYVNGGADINRIDVMVAWSGTLAAGTWAILEGIRQPA